MTRRYSVVLDPSEVYFVWDEERVAPVMSGDKLLVFLKETDANRAALLLNQVDNDNAAGPDARRISIPQRPSPIRLDKSISGVTLH